MSGSPKAGKIAFVPPGSKLQCETAYWLYGNIKAGVPLICLHGGPGVPGRYLLPLARLNKDYNIPVIFYDQIGCGESTHLPDRKGDTKFWTLDLMLAELRNLIVKLGIKEAHDVYGHSFGGMLAARYALAQPSGLRKIVIHSTPASVPRRQMITQKQRVAMGGEFAEIFRKAEETGITNTPEFKRANIEFQKRYICRLDPWPKVFQESLALSLQDTTVSMAMYGPDVGRLTGSCKGFDVSSFLPLVTQKTVPGGILLMNGKYDAAQDEVMEPFFTQPHARVKWVRFGESSHMPMLEEPESFLSVLGAFLEMD